MRLDRSKILSARLRVIFFYHKKKAGILTAAGRPIKNSKKNDSTQRAWPCAQKFYEVTLHNGLQIMKLVKDSGTMNDWPAVLLPLALPEMRHICEVQI